MQQIRVDFHTFRPLPVGSAKRIQRRTDELVGDMVGMGKLEYPNYKYSRHVTGRRELVGGTGIAILVDFVGMKRHILSDDGVQVFRSIIHEAIGDAITNGGWFLDEESLESYQVYVVANPTPLKRRPRTEVD